MGVGMHVINCHYHYFALVNGTDQLFKNEMNTSFEAFENYFKAERPKYFILQYQPLPIS